MTRASTYLLSNILLLSIAACSESPTPAGELPGCRTGNCGKSSFRAAVPTRAELRIASPTGKARMRRATAATVPPIGHSRHVALEAVSPALLMVDEQVVEINTVIDSVFGDLEAAAGTTPEVESDTEHQWRTADSDVPGHDNVLRITSSDGVRFEVDYFFVPTGGALAGEPLVSGEVIARADDDLEFELEIDLDAAADANAAFDGQGQIVIAAKPLAGGEAELWYDYHAVSIEGSAVETSRTTSWSWAPDSGALEFLADIEGVEATIYARWDSDGGRYDHHLSWNDPDVGLVDEIATNCWSPSGAEDFDAWAVIDQDLNYYGELDGDEADCDFGPAADHPMPGADFDDLPEDGEWELLELLSWCEVSSAC